MRFVLHSFFSVMLAALVAGLGVAYFTEVNHRTRLKEMAAHPCDSGVAWSRPECREAPVLAADSRPGPLPPLVLPQINALEIGPLPGLVEAAETAEPLEIRAGSATPEEPAAVVSEEPAAVVSTVETPPAPLPPSAAATRAFQELIAKPDPARSFSPVSSAASPAFESPLFIPPLTAPVTPPPTLAQPTPPASPGGVTPQAKTTQERKPPVRPARRAAERRPAPEEIIQPEFDAAPVRATPRLSPQPPRAVTSAPLLLPGAVEATNTLRD